MFLRGVVLGVDFANSGWVSMVPHLVSFVFLNVAGNIADRMVKSGMTITKVRKTCQSIGFGRIAGALFVVGEVDSAWLAITMMCIGNAIGGFVTGGVTLFGMIFYLLFASGEKQFD